MLSTVPKCRCPVARIHILSHKPFRDTRPNALSRIFGDEFGDPAVLRAIDAGLDFLPEEFGTIEGCIGNTPLVRLQRMVPNRRNVILAKLEGNNPAGSVKDRAALSLIARAEEKGQIKASCWWRLRSECLAEERGAIAPARPVHDPPLRKPPALPHPLPCSPGTP